MEASKGLRNLTPETMESIEVFPFSGHVGTLLKKGHLGKKRFLQFVPGVTQDDSFALKLKLRLSGNIRPSGRGPSSHHQDVSASSPIRVCSSLRLGAGFAPNFRMGQLLGLPDSTFPPSAIGMSAAWEKLKRRFIIFA